MGGCLCGRPIYFAHQSTLLARIHSLLCLSPIFKINNVNIVDIQLLAANTPAVQDSGSGFGQHLFFAVIAGLLPLCITGYLLSRHFASKAAHKAGKASRSTPPQHGVFTVIYMLLPCIVVAVVLAVLQMIFPDKLDIPKPMLLTAFLAIAATAGLNCLKYTQRISFRAREHVESIIRWMLLLSAFISVITTAGIVISIFLESLNFFSKVDPLSFLFGTEWNPGAAFTESTGRVEANSAAKFGSVPLFWGSFYITFIALAVSVPIGLLSAIYLSEFSIKPIRFIAKPALEILAGIPTVVYGFFAALTVAPLIVKIVHGINSGLSLEIPVDGMNALAPGIVMGIMIIPFISSLSDDIINSVPNSMREASLALGATCSETVCKVIVPAAMPGIISACVLAFSRAIGETMIVVMAAGGRANLTANPLEGMTTVTVKIVEALTGDTEFDNPATLSAFALGLVLFVLTLALNMFAVMTIRRFKKI